jgi:protocatechuate 3,4-dioxygenase beta subunit
VRTLILATALGLLAGGAQAQNHVTTQPGPFQGWRTFSGTEDGQSVTGTSRPGPFPGYRETDVNRGGHVTHCTTRPGPFGRTTTDCQ